MKKKFFGILVSLLAVAMLTTPFIGAVLAGYGGKNKATFNWEVQLWGLNPIAEDTRSKTIVKEDGTMIITSNVHVIGEPDLLDDTPVWGDYPHGGIRLTVTPEGEDQYILVGSFEKLMHWIVMVPRGGMLENSRWSFTITGYEGETVPPEGYMDSTMYGTLINMQGGSEMVIKSTKGTGIFEGAFLRGTHVTTAVYVFNPTPPPVFTIFSDSIGSGEIVFP